MCWANWTTPSTPPVSRSIPSWPLSPKTGEEIISPNPEEVEEVFTIPLSFLRYNPPQKARVEKAYRAVDALPERGPHSPGGTPQAGEHAHPFLVLRGAAALGMTARVTDWLLHWLKGLG